MNHRRPGERRDDRAGVNCTQFDPRHALRFGRDDAGCSAAFGLVPQRVHLGERGVFERAALGRQRALDIAKAALEFGVGAAQRHFRIGVDMARQIDQREQQIAGLVREFVRVAAVERRLDLVGFLADLVQHRARIVPVEADGGGLALQFHRARQRRLPGLDAGQQRLVRGLFRRPPRGALGLFLGLDALPRALDAGRRELPSLSANTCGCRRIILRVIGLDHVAERERVLLLRHAGVIHHLQQEIAEFLAEIVEIAARDGVGDLIGFLDGVGRDRRKILLEVPGAAGDRACAAPP